MPIYDYTCPNCEHEVKNELAKCDEEVHCPECDTIMVKDNCAPHMFTKIIPTYPGSQRHKAGYVHKFGNRPATKTQVGYGGGVSSDNPTGGSKSQD